MQRKIYQNVRNEHKFMDVVRYSPGHYYAAQFMHWENGVTNYNGGRNGKRRRYRIGKKTLDGILEDYKEVQDGGNLQ